MNVALIDTDKMLHNLRGHRVEENFKIHTARAWHMSKVGRVAEARHYLRHFALSSLSHARRERQHAREPWQFALVEQIREEGEAYAHVARIFCAGAAVVPANVMVTVGASYWRPLRNPHWPDLDSHGVYVCIHNYAARKNPGYLVEVQVLPPDLKRTQVCPTRRFAELADADVFAREWITVGNAIVSAEMDMHDAASPGWEW